VHDGKKADRINCYPLEGLTRNQVVDVVSSPERKLTYESKPGQQPSRELLGEYRQTEWFLSATTQFYARLICQGNGLLGVGHGVATVIGPALGGVAVREIDQALGEVGRGSGRNEEQGEEGDICDSAESWHESDLGRGVARRQEGSEYHWLYVYGVLGDC